MTGRLLELMMESTKLDSTSLSVTDDSGNELDKELSEFDNELDKEPDDIADWSGSWLELKLDANIEDPRREFGETDWGKLEREAKEEPGKDDNAEASKEDDCCGNKLALKELPLLVNSDGVEMELIEEAPGNIALAETPELLFGMDGLLKTMIGWILMCGRPRLSAKSFGPMYIFSSVFNLDTCDTCFMKCLDRLAACSAAILLGRRVQHGRTRGEVHGEHSYPSGQQNRFERQHTPFGCGHFIPWHTTEPDLETVPKGPELER